MTCKLNEYPELASMLAFEHPADCPNGALAYELWHRLPEGYEPHEYELCDDVKVQLEQLGVDFALNPPEQSWTPEVQRERGVLPEAVIDNVARRGGPANVDAGDAVNEHAAAMDARETRNLDVRQPE